MASRPSDTGVARPAGVSFATSLTFAGVTHRFGTTVVLRGVDLQANPGEILCLLGPSGSGKTTLLRIGAGLEREHGGSVLIGEREIGGPARFVPPEGRGIAYMFQDFALFPHMSLLRNVMFGLHSLPIKDATSAARAALQRVGLDHAEARYPHMLSGGQQQRVALARALAPRPGVILMDEPFSGLDARLRDEVRADTLRILRETRATAIVVTHDAEEAMRMGDRIALLRDGRVLQAGTASELYHAPRDLFAARFLSDVNVLEGRADGVAIDTAVGRMTAPRPITGPVQVALRPTAFDVDENGSLDGRVVARRFLGGAESFTLAVEGRSEPLRVSLREGTVAAEATRVRLRVRDSDVLVFESARANA